MQILFKNLELAEGIFFNFFKSKKIQTNQKVKKQEKR